MARSRYQRDGPGTGQAAHTMTYHPDERAQERRAELETRLLVALMKRDALIFAERMEARTRIVAAEPPPPPQSPVRERQSLSPFDPINSYSVGRRS